MTLAEFLLEHLDGAQREMVLHHVDCGDTCPTLGILVEPLRDHPDCKPEWPLLPAGEPAR